MSVKSVNEHLQMAAMLSFVIMKGGGAGGGSRQGAGTRTNIGNQSNERSEVGHI